MKHRFNLWYDFLLPILNKIVGKKFGCCGKIKNCSRCCAKNGYEMVEKWAFEERLRLNKVQKGGTK